MKSLVPILLLSTVLFSISCSELTPFQEGDNIDQMSLEEVAKTIHDHVGEAEADHLSQCSMLPIGAKPCGGPWGYLVFSSENSSETFLKKLINRYNVLDAKRNKEEGRMSTCDIARKPDLVLTDGTCRGEKGHAWNPGDILMFNGIKDD
jgi:hypothetical protein